MNLKNWSRFITEENNVRKTIMYMIICKQGSPNWSDCVENLRNIKFPTSVETSVAHHRHLSLQVLLDTDIEESTSFCEGLLNKFLPENPLILISEVNVKIKNTPIGLWQDSDLVYPGRYFDELVNKEKKGLFII